MPLQPDIIDAIGILNRGSEGIAAVMETSDSTNRFRHALEDLQRLADDHQIPIAIVGGLGAIRYGYPAATQDIDIAVAKDHLANFLRVSPSYGLRIAWESKSGWHTLMHGDVEINVVPEGGKARDTAPTEIPSPMQMGVESGLRYAAIESWIELKISSGRQKDRAHVVEVLKKTDESFWDRIRQHLQSIHASYHATFEALLVEAMEERRQELGRRE